MRIKWSGLAVMAGGLFLLMGSSPGCIATVRVRPAVVVVDDAPPEPRYEAAPAARSGYVWVRGHWEFRNNRWKWKRGYWKASRASHVWVAGHWERRGNRHHWVAGHWQRGGGGVVVRDHRPPPNRGGGGGGGGSVDVGIWIDVAPPAPKRAAPGTKAGYVWVAGRWEWRNSNWKWRRGRWQKARTGYAWVPGYWERKGNRHRWVKGSWKSGGGGVIKRDHRKKERKEERVPVRRGKR